MPESVEEHPSAPSAARAAVDRTQEHRSSPVPHEPIDPDVDLHQAAQRAETAGAGLALVLGVVAAGGVIGALARYAVTLAWPVTEDGFPWSTLAINVFGSALIGALLPLVSEDGHQERPLVRLFAGTGVLGGFTTFSAYAYDLRALLVDDRALLALVYAVGTVVGCLVAVGLTATATRRAIAIHRRTAAG
ncbi:CrcB family protein [Streptomyces sp. NPDC005963]|uniref:fluoride efflux transporter FluC n=1 Tax=Streptomyces sp. NPDC005963 TaxID=3156721 RepID=UPI0033D54C15